MKRTRWCMAILAALSAHLLFAQDITGTWQGAIRPPQREEARVKLKISSVADGEMRATLFPISPTGGRPIPGHRVTLEGNTVTMLLLPQGANYVGELSSDGNRIEGGIVPPGGFGIPIPFNLARATPETEWTLDTPPVPAPMAADADPAFETASVTPAGPKAPGFVMGTSHEFNAAGMSLADLIKWAYRVNDRQIEGGPDWIRTEAFNLNGRPGGEGAPSQAQWRTMVRKLLEERFKLSLRVEKRELPVYILNIDESGPRLVPTDDPTARPYPPFPPGAWATMNTSLPEMAAMLTVLALDRPVLDRTGLEGAFDFALIWKPDRSRFSSAVIRADTWERLPPYTQDAPDLATAMRNELGLEFESTTASVDVLVIQRAERPASP